MLECFLDLLSHIPSGQEMFGLDADAVPAVERNGQPITDSARGMVNTVYDSLLNGK